MTSFRWKRKAGAKVSKQLTQAFSAQAKDEDSDPDETFDWLSMAPRKTFISLEDGNAKSERLKIEGATLAEAERYWEALKKWEEAIQLAPHNFKVLDMKAQALMAVGEVFPALQAAEKTVKVAPTWWPGHQTLGRALANVGEVRMALKSFCRAVHLNPGEQELWTEDLLWAKSLLDHHRLSQQQQEEELAAAEAGGGGSTVTITELKDSDDDDDDDHNDGGGGARPVVMYNGGGESAAGVDGREGGNGLVDHRKRVRRLPKNYVQMRDPT